MSEQNNPRPAVQVVLLTAPSRVMAKNNEAKSLYVIYTAEIIEENSPAKGMRLTVSFTTRNAKGEVKQAPSKGEIQTIFLSQGENGKVFGEIGSEIVARTDDATLANALSGLFLPVGQGV